MSCPKGLPAKAEYRWKRSTKNVQTAKQVGLVVSIDFFSFFLHAFFVQWSILSMLLLMPPPPPPTFHSFECSNILITYEKQHNCKTYNFDFVKCHPFTIENCEVVNVKHNVNCAMYIWTATIFWVLTTTMHTLTQTYTHTSPTWHSHALGQNQNIMPSFALE